MSYKTKISTISRLFYISALALLFTILTPYMVVANETPFTQAQYISQTAQSNPYQALVYVLSTITGISLIAMGYVYNQQTTNIKEQSILHLVLNNDIVERSSDNPFKNFDIMNL